MGSVFEIRMSGNVVFVRIKWSDATNLYDALVARHDRQLVNGHEVLAKLLVIEAVGVFTATTFPQVLIVDGPFTQCGVEFFQGGRFLAAQKDGGIAVADDGICVVLIKCF